MIHVRVLFERHKFVHADGAEPADPAQIITLEVNQHQMFGAFFFICPQFRGEPLILGLGVSPRSRACNRPGFRVPFRQANQTFR
jgi:hypothetical protein